MTLAELRLLRSQIAPMSYRLDGPQPFDVAPHLDLVIGVSGPFGSGKDTAAAHLTTELVDKGWLVLKFAFADPLKQELSAATKIPLEWFYESDTPQQIERKKAVRPLMQIWGTEFRRNPILMGDPNYWLWKARREVENWLATIPDDALNRKRAVILTDVRFDNEATWCLELSPAVSQILTIDSTGVGTTVNSEHSSEGGLDPAIPQTRILNMHDNMHDVPHGRSNFIGGLSYVLGEFLREAETARDGR